MFANSYNKYYKKSIKDILISIVTSTESFCAGLLLYFELLFHLKRFGFGGDNLGYKLLFGLFYGLAFGIVVSLLPRIVAIIMTFVFTAFFTIYFLVQVVYSGVFSTYLSVAGSIKMTGQAFDFTDVIWKEILNEWWLVLLMIAPIVLLSIWLRKLIDFDRHGVMTYLISISGTVMLFVIIISSMSLNKKGVYSTYEVYKDYTSVDMAVEKLGITETMILDTKLGIKEKFGKNDDKTTFMAENLYEETTEFDANANPDSSLTNDSNTTNTSNAANTSNTANNTSKKAAKTNGKSKESNDDSKEAKVDTSPNILDIDMNELIDNESNQNIKALHEYISTVKPTNKNEYTGMFKDYNLIYIVAEGFSGYVVDEKRTPTLYKLCNSGFVFDNYYTPLWYGSTVAGEYADLTGLPPKNGGYLSMIKSGQNKNDMYFCLSKQLAKKGYTVKGYHNNDYTYYDRNISHPNLGYDWIGVGNGYEPELGESNSPLWPQSDLRMIENTFDEYASNQPFHTYYLTVSGHVMYNFSGNAMAKRHEDITTNLDYGESTKAYIACQYELELALRKLLDSLEEKGIADKTVIVLTADHVPYDNKEVEDELAGKTLDNTFEVYKNKLIIWSGSMEKPVYVKKYCSSLDILPTVSNLMGLEYDSRMMVGQDILSDSEPLVMFNDRSFITDKCFYNANTGAVTPIDNAIISDEYIDNKITQVRNKFSMAESICDYDYYKYIDEYISSKKSEKTDKTDTDKSDEKTDKTDTDKSDEKMTN